MFNVFLLLSFALTESPAHCNPTSKSSEWSLVCRGLEAPLVIKSEWVAGAGCGHEGSSQLVPGGVQGEILELLWYLFPFLGPLVETQRVQQAADLVRFHFLHRDGLVFEETQTHQNTHLHRSEYSFSSQKSQCKTTDFCFFIVFFLFVWFYIDWKRFVSYFKAILDRSLWQCNEYI